MAPLIIYGDRIRDRVERELPSSPAQAKSTDDVAACLGIQPAEVARACMALRRFGAAAFKLSPPKKNTNRRKLWWKV